MEAAEAVTRLGGIGTASAIVQLSSRRSLARGIKTGALTQLARGTYALVGVDRDRASAAQLGGARSHLSAALAHGWEVKRPPERSWVTVPRGRRLTAKARAATHVTYAALDPAERRTGVTAPIRTVIDCARTLPFDEALAVADSALRSQDVRQRSLVEAADLVRGKGAANARRVALNADGRAANPFESVLRALILDCGLSGFEPQARVLAGDREWHPDLVNRDLGVVVEADSWTFHATRAGHSRDCVRYNALSLEGWVVLRFTWEQVMLAPDYVVATLSLLRPRPPRRTKRSAKAA